MSDIYKDGKNGNFAVLYGNVKGTYVDKSNTYVERTMGRGLPTDNAERKKLQLHTYMFQYFPDAWLATANVSIAGNEQHNPGEPLHWARDKSTDQMNTMWRHIWDYSMGVMKDVDGQYHLAKAAWRILAELQLLIEHDARNAKIPDPTTINNPVTKNCSLKIFPALFQDDGASREDLRKEINERDGRIKELIRQNEELRDETRYTLPEDKF